MRLASHHALAAIRNRFHPLHQLRRSRFLSTHVLPRLDVPVRLRPADVEWPVYARLIRHLSYVLDSSLLEPGTRALFFTLVDRLAPRVFWDVGANIGIYSWLFLTRVPDGVAVLLEPEPDNLALLRRTMAAGAPAVTCLPLAASDRSGKAAFRRDPVTGATGGLDREVDPFIGRHYGLTSPSMKVQTVALDDLVAHQPPPDLVKIDVEGAELSVLRGARQLLHAHSPVVLFEATGANRDEAIEIFGEAGYVVFASSGPNDSVMAANDFIALPPRVRDMWSQLCLEWRRRLESVRGSVRPS